MTAIQPQRIRLRRIGGWRLQDASLIQLCAIADSFNARDLELGRIRADYYAATLLADGVYLDRKRV